MCEWRAHAQLPVLGMASAGASRTLFTSSFDGEIKEWDADNGNFRQMFVMVVSIEHCSVHCDDHDAFINKSFPGRRLRGTDRGEVASLRGWVPPGRKQHGRGEYHTSFTARIMKTSSFMQH